MNHWKGMTTNGGRRVASFYFYEDLVAGIDETFMMPLGRIEEGDIIEFGNTKLETLFTPGHSPASLSFYCAESKFVIAGDVLFRESIGRTDLPGGNFETLKASIQNKLYVLPDEVVVYAGHMGSTTIGHEKVFNGHVRG